MFFSSALGERDLGDTIKPCGSGEFNQMWGQTMCIVKDGHLIFPPLTQIHLFFTAGSYVALTLLGRPPGSPQIPLSEVDVGLGSPGCFGDPFVTSPNSYNAAERTSSPLVPWVSTPYILVVQYWNVFISGIAYLLSVYFPISLLQLNDVIYIFICSSLTFLNPTLHRKRTVLHTTKEWTTRGWCPRSNRTCRSESKYQTQNYLVDYYK